MKLLVVGGGGREHALAWKLAQSPRVQKVFVAPGNGGTASEPGVQNVTPTETAALIDLCRREQIQLTLVGPEAPLAAGIVDAFRDAGLRIFGPTRAAAQLESSKDFAKSFMVRHGLPTARHRSFDNARDARAYIAAERTPIVVKADGLAAGKGVVVAATREEANAALDAMLVQRRYGAAGGRVGVEEFLEGEEASFIVMCDGTHVLPLATSQDHKRVRDGDQCPNTGGMGAYSPAPIVTPKVHARVMREIIQPAVEGMAQEGHPYVGLLYAGLPLDTAGGRLPRVPRRHQARWRRARHERRPRALRHCARRFVAHRAQPRLRSDRAHPLRRHAVPARYRPSRIEEKPLGCAPWRGMRRST